MSIMAPICLQLFAMPIQMDKANGVYLLKLLPSTALLDRKHHLMHHLYYHTKLSSSGMHIATVYADLQQSPNASVACI